MNNQSFLYVQSAMTIRLATDADIVAVFALYRSLVGTPYCAWSAAYPTQDLLCDDVDAQALYLLEHDEQLIAAGTIRYLAEHDSVCAWTRCNPCDLLRLGVSRAWQGRGVGAYFLKQLGIVAKQRGYDAMRILVSKRNSPAVALYRKTSARYCGDTTAYAIDWHCFELDLATYV